MSVTDSPIAPLLQPLTIRGVTLPNRLAMAPMTRSFCPNGIPRAANADYYWRRAEGGTGLIVTEAIGVDHPASVGDTGLGETDLPLFGAEGSVEAWRKVTDAVHAAGAKILPQAWHQGVMRLPGSFRHPEVPNFAPSGRYGDKSKAADYYRDMAEKLDIPLPVPTDNEIVEVIESFGRAAEEAVAAGFDGFAFHGAHGYLIDAFLWEETNQRTDRWGGDRKRRTLFACELVRRVRRAIGEDRPIIFRFSQWKQQDFKAKLGHTPAELEEVLGPMADAGVDLFDASVRYFDTPAFEGSDLSLAGWAKKLTGKLSGAVGGIGFDKGGYDSYDPITGKAKEKTDGTNNLPRVLRRFEAGEFDIISIGRALLSDPDWSRKASAGEPFEPFNMNALKSLT